MIVYDIYNGQAPRSIAAAMQSCSGPNNVFRLLLRTTFNTDKGIYADETAETTGGLFSVTLHMGESWDVEQLQCLIVFDT